MGTGKHSIEITKTSQSIKANIRLPGSKSESNRALIMQALCKTPFEINNLSEAEDTIILKQILSSLESPHPISDVQSLNVGPAGTAMRFLTAFLSTRQGSYILTGTHRIPERPIGQLVDALRQLGADISYQKKENYPPLHINGRKLGKASEINLPGNISSQYISALLMIAPYLSQGLTLRIIGDMASKPYVEMTLSMMKELGVSYTNQGHIIKVPSQAYQPRPLFIEPDWSGASYWYLMVALARHADIKLYGLKANSKQGDSIVAEMMRPFGVKTKYQKDGVLLTKCPIEKDLPKHLNFEHCPDIAQTFAVLCSALGHNCTFSGLESLKIKETDRVKALQNELAKFHIHLLEQNKQYILNTDQSILKDQNSDQISPIEINTYHDHRMAMAFSPLALLTGILKIENPDVVGKSYPGFWSDMKACNLDYRYSSI